MVKWENEFEKERKIKHKKMVEKLGNKKTFFRKRK
jgi:hypothetical protein